MAGLSSIRGRGPGGPLVESIRESPELRAAVSPQSIYTYDEKRADYVERPGWGESKYEQLAKALRGLNPELTRMMAVGNQRFSEEQTAEGRELMHRNKMAWNEFVQANPEYAGLNPHLERGYKSADLETKAYDYQAALQDFYTTGGMANETDPEKVRESLNNFSKEWVSTNVQRGEFDPDLYNDHFLKPAEQAEGGVLSRYTQDRADEHLKQAVDKYSQLFASGIDSVLGGGANISDPDVSNGLSTNAATMMQEMEANGVPRTLAQTAVENAIINLAQAEGEEGYGDELLALAGKVKTGTGTLGGRPEFKAKVAQLQKQWESERRQKQSEYMQMVRFNKDQARDAAVPIIVKALSDAYNSGKPITDATTLLALPGVGVEHADIVNNLSNMFRGMKTFQPIMDQQTQTELAEAHLKARMGQMSPQEAVGMSGRYGLNATTDLVDTAYTAISGKDPVSIALQSPGVSSAVSTMEAQMLVFSAGAEKLDQETIKARAIEAKELLLDKVSVYVQEGERSGKSKSAEEIRVFARETAAALGKEAATRDFSLQRDIQTPEEKSKMGSAEYWQTNSKQYFTNTETASAELWAYVRDPKGESTNLQTRYGIPPQMVEKFAGNQAKLFGWDLGNMLLQYDKEQTDAAEKANRSYLYNYAIRR